MIVSKPKALSWEQAAGIPENWLTAFQALFLIGDMQKGESVLIHAGASGRCFNIAYSPPHTTSLPRELKSRVCLKGVGIAANQLAKVFGAWVHFPIRIFLFLQFLLIQHCSSARDHRERVITTAGSDKKLERLKELGATNGINYHNQDFAEEVRSSSRRRPPRQSSAAMN